MIFSDSDLDMLNSIGEDNLAWGVFEPIRPTARNIEWHLYDNRTEHAVSGLPEWSVVTGYSSTREDAVTRAKAAYLEAVEFLNQGVLWKEVEHFVKPEPEPEPEPVYELGNDQPVDGLAERVEALDQEVQSIETETAMTPAPKGFLRRRRDGAHQL